MKRKWKGIEWKRRSPSNLYSFSSFSFFSALVTRNFWSPTSGNGQRALVGNRKTFTCVISHLVHLLHNILLLADEREGGNVLFFSFLFPFFASWRLYFFASGIFGNMIKDDTLRRVFGLCLCPSTSLSRKVLEWKIFSLSLKGGVLYGWQKLSLILIPTLAVVYFKKKNAGVCSFFLGWRVRRGVTRSYRRLPPFSSSQHFSLAHSGFGNNFFF